MAYAKISGFSDEIASDIKTQFEVLNKLGIKYFEPRGVDGKNISELNDDEVKALKEKMEKYGIKVSSIGSHFGKVKLTDDLDAHFEMFKRVVETAKMLDAKYIRIFSFYHDGEEWTDAERELVLSELKKLIAYAKENDVVLLHENEKDIYGDIAPRCLDLMKELAKDGMTMVIVTHEMGFAREVADKVIFIDEGVIKECGTPTEVFDHPKNPRLQEFLSKVL